MKKIILLSLFIVSYANAQKKKNVKYETEFTVLKSDQYSFSIHKLKLYDNNDIDKKNKKANKTAIKENGPGIAKGLFYDNKFIYYYFNHRKEDLKYLRYKFSKKMSLISYNKVTEEEIINISK